MNKEDYEEIYKKALETNNMQQKTIISPIKYNFKEYNESNTQQEFAGNYINQGSYNNIDINNQPQICNNVQNSQQAYNFNQQQDTSYNQNYNVDIIDLNNGFFNLENIINVPLACTPTEESTPINMDPYNFIGGQIPSSPGYNNQYYNSNACFQNNSVATNIVSTDIVATDNYRINQSDFNILISLKNQLDEINQNENQNENYWQIQLCGVKPVSLEQTKANLVKFFNNSETRHTFVKVLLESKRVKVLQNKIVCNLKGYWEDTSKMKDMDRYDNLSTVFYIETKNILGQGISLFNINRLIGTDKDLWNPIEKMILSERQFLFESDEGNKPLKQIVRENDWINFKSYIVNPRTLEVIKKQTAKIDELEVDVTSYILENDLTFDCCINTDPQVIECNGEYMLKEEENISADVFEYFCQTSLGNNKDKRKLLLQHLGYSISSNKDKKKALYVIGAPNTGKTRLENLLRSYYDETLIAEKALPAINSDASRHELMQAKINIADEADGNSITKLNTFKKIISGSKQSYTRYGVARSDYYNLGLVFLANEFINPVSGNETPVGYLDKFSILKTESFDFKSAKLGKEEFKETFVDEDNKSKVITLALYELNRLYQNEFEFVETEDAEEEKVNHVNKWIAKELKKGSKESYIRSQLKGFKYSPYDREYINDDECTIEGIDKIAPVKNKEGVIELFPSKEAITDEDLMKAFIDEKLEFVDANLNPSVKSMDISMVDLEKGIFNIYKNFTSHRVDVLDLLKAFTEFKLSKQTSNTDLKFLLNKIEEIQNEDKSKIKDIRNKLTYFLNLMKSELTKNKAWVIEENKYKVKKGDSDSSKEQKNKYREECRTKAIESILDNHKVIILKELRVKNKSGASSRLGFVGIKFKE